MKPWEGNHVDGEFPEISVELTWEPEASGDTGHSGGDKMVEITIGGSGEFKSSEADIVESLVINTVRLLCLSMQTPSP